MSSALQPRLSDALARNNAFVLYRKPGQTTVRAMFATGSGADNAGDSFVFAPFASGREFLLQASRCDVFDFPQPDVDFIPATPELAFDAGAKHDFEQIVAKALEAIHNNHFEKVVLSRKETVVISAPVFDIFSRLLQLYPDAFVSVWNHRETGCWIGATPERLLKGREQHFETMALAGTQAYQGADVVEWPQKEQQEQRLVTDYIWNTLEPLTKS
ncbi:MAG: hypothetical protein EOO01_03640, partial [Chitinophagaceae bacterium]